MIAFPGYWTTAQFTDAYGLLGWVEQPRRRTWDPNRLWVQMRTWSGPTDNTKAFIALLETSPADGAGKAFQLGVTSDGPISEVAATWYSDDYDGLLPRSALITTWSMSKNVGTQSILEHAKSINLFRGPLKKTLLLRIGAAANMFRYGLAAQEQDLATTQRYPKWGMIKMLNTFFATFVLFDRDAVGGKGLMYADVDGDLPLQWQACQLYRLICRGETTAPMANYVLSKTQVGFPKAVLMSGASIGGGIETNYDRIFYAYSTKALLDAEPTLGTDMASLLKVGQFPIMWWVKQPPDVQQTSDARWQIIQHWYAVKQFTPYHTPWVTAPGETFTIPGQFNPNSWDDGAAANEPVEPEYSLSGQPYGRKPPFECYQWSANLQRAIFGGNQTYQNLGNPL
jgi:hypothetical protein